MKQKRIAGALLSACAATLALTACSGGEAGQQKPAAPHNDADVTFAQQMIPHHRQALEMVDMVDSRTDNAELTELAEQIGSEQQPEIEKMTSWLKNWGAEVPEGTDMDHGDMQHGGPGGAHGEHDMSGMDNGMQDPSGMMSEKDMKALEKAKNAEFDRMWLDMMIEHHEGAIDMARTEQRAGKADEAMDLASGIMRTQDKEIKTMKAQLKS